jgi:hypothetical protein
MAHSVDRKQVAAASVAGVVARCVQVRAIDETQAVELIAAELTTAGYRPGSAAAEAILTLASEVYAVPDNDGSRWYYGNALSLLGRLGADIEAARIARRNRPAGGQAAW